MNSATLSALILPRRQWVNEEFREGDDRTCLTVRRPVELSASRVRTSEKMTAPASRSREGALRERLRAMLGVDLTAIPTAGVETAPTFAAEVGPDLSRFPTAAHFCSWLGLAPGTRVSGDKRLGGPPARQANRLGQALRMAATTARGDKSVIGAMHRRRLARMDTAKAIKATAHHLACLGSPRRNG